jgi:hypothetical protein
MGLGVPWPNSEQSKDRTTTVGEISKTNQKLETRFVPFARLPPWSGISVRHQLLTSRLTISGHGDVTVGIRDRRFSTFSSVSSLVLTTMAEAAQWDEARWELVMKKMSCLVQKVDSLVGGGGRQI